MSNYKRVLKHLYKESLSTKKVELSLVSDANKAVADLKGKAKLLIDLQQDFAKSTMELRQTKQKAQDVAKINPLNAGGSFKIKPYSVLDDIKNAAKELGVDVKKIDGYGDLNDALEAYELQLKKAENQKKDLIKQIK